MVELTRDSWGKSKSKRTEKYDFWQKQGFGDKEAYYARDWGYDRAVRESKFVGPRKPVKKVVKYKKNPKYDDALWSDTSSYWNKSPGEKAEIYKGWPLWRKRIVRKWEKEALQKNMKLYEEESPEVKRIVPKSDAEVWSAGYAYVYRHYIKGDSWLVADRYIQKRLRLTPQELHPEDYPDYDPDVDYIDEDEEEDEIDYW